MRKGQRIRSYYLEPKPLVVDHRTGVKTSDVQSVLDGDLDPFISAQLLADIRPPMPGKQ